MKKVKEVIGKKYVALVLALMAVMATTAGAFADDSMVVTAVTSGLTTASTDIMSILTAVIPIALGIVAAVLGVKFGVRFFKSMVR